MPKRSRRSKHSKRQNDSRRQSERLQLWRWRSRKIFGISSRSTIFSTWNVLLSRCSASTELSWTSTHISQGVQRLLWRKVFELSIDGVSLRHHRSHLLRTSRPLHLCYTFILASQLPRLKTRKDRPPRRCFIPIERCTVLIGTSGEMKWLSSFSIDLYVVFERSVRSRSARTLIISLKHNEYHCITHSR